MTASNRVLVLGGGGRVGTAWMAGLLLGLERAGVDLGQIPADALLIAAFVIAAAKLGGYPGRRDAAAAVR